MNKRRLARILANTVIAALAVAAGVWLSSYFRATEVEAPREVRPDEGTLVEAMRVAAHAHPVSVTGFGTVIPARTATLRAEIAGRVVELNDDLVMGGELGAGEMLVRIDPRDYRLAVEELETAVEQARSQLALERGREAVAQREWALFEDEADEVLGELGAQYEGLATREPQIRAARAQVEATRARLERARLDLSRARIEVPFDALVIDEQVEVGDLVTPQSVIATLVGTDTFWVQVSVPVEQVPLVEVPGVNAPDGGGSPATIALDSDGLEVRRRGEVVRLLGELDPQGRMARLLVAIDDPLAVDAAGLPMLLGAYVRVEIHLDEPVRGIEIPRAAVHEGDEIYVVDDGRLDIREIDPLWRFEDSVLVGHELSPGELVVTSPIEAPLEGMKLRVGEVEPPPPPPAPAPHDRVTRSAGVDVDDEGADEDADGDETAPPPLPEVLEK